MERIPVDTCSPGWPPRWPERARLRPEGSYTVRFLDNGIPKISQKVGEEAVEVVVAANSEDDERLASEAADLLYHLLVLLQARGVPLDAVWRQLEERRGTGRGIGEADR